MDKAKVFMSGNSQAVRLPQAYRLTDEYVYIKKEGNNLILIPASSRWDTLIESLGMFTEDFMEERVQLEFTEREGLCDDDVHA